MTRNEHILACLKGVKPNPSNINKVIRRYNLFEFLLNEVHNEKRGKPNDLHGIRKLRYRVITKPILDLMDTIDSRVANETLLQATIIVFLLFMRSFYRSPRIKRREIEVRLLLQ